ncbi:MAG: dihydrolipoyllysine-residue acetyltransferase [Arenimonas sp.]
MAELLEARVPDIGSDSGVPVIELLVKVGDTVAKDQGLVTLESDKATMEVPSPFAGIVRELKVAIGDEITTGALVAMIEAGEGDAGIGATASAQRVVAEAGAAAGAAAAPAVASSNASVPAATQAGAAAVVPAAAPAAASSVAAPTQLPSSSASASAAGAPTPVAATPTTRLPGAEELAHGNLPYASPAVRVFARELGVDLSRVTGSERGGRISKQDVQSHVKAQLTGGAPSPTATSSGGLQLLPWPQVDFAKFGDIERVARSRINKISGANLARNWAMIPHVTQFEEADITEMEAFRKKLGEEHKDTKITPLVFLIKAVVAALKKFPSFNASLDGDELVLKKYFHVGIAVDTPDGLMVPVLRDCDRKGLLELSTELAAISARARDKKLGPNDMQGGCFSISSLGGIGGTAFTPIINAPEVAILGVSKAQMKPVWNGSDFAPRLLLPLALSYDHRVIDGAAAARFTTYLAQVLADLRRLLV